MFLNCQKKSLESKIFALYVDHSIVPFKKSTTMLLCCFIKELRQYVMPIIVRSHIITEKEEKKRLFFNMPPSLYPMLLDGLYPKVQEMCFRSDVVSRDASKYFLIIFSIFGVRHPFGFCMHHLKDVKNDDHFMQVMLKIQISIWLSWCLGRLPYSYNVQSLSFFVQTFSSETLYFLFIREHCWRGVRTLNDTLSKLTKNHRIKLRHCQ
jgi:hypothetical protein